MTFRLETLFGVDSRIIVGLPRLDNIGKILLTLIAKQTDAVAVIEQYCWQDGKQIFDTSTKHLHLIQDKNNSLSNRNILRWNIT